VLGYLGVNSKGGLIAIRLVLGIVEAGFFVGSGGLDLVWDLLIRERSLERYSTCPSGTRRTSWLDDTPRFTLLLSSLGVSEDFWVRTYPSWFETR
jgi:hypothetical protein